MTGLRVRRLPDHAAALGRRAFNSNAKRLPASELLTSQILAARPGRFLRLTPRRTGGYIPAPSKALAPGRCCRNCRLRLNEPRAGARNSGQRRFRRRLFCTYIYVRRPTRLRSRHAAFDPQIPHRPHPFPFDLAQRPGTRQRPDVRAAPGTGQAYADTAITEDDPNPRHRATQEHIRQYILQNLAPDAEGHRARCLMLVLPRTRTRSAAS